MLSDKITKQLNEQITKELYSSYLYLQMAAWLDSQTLPGFASWMKIQAQEEIAHAMIFYNYVNERGGVVDLGAIGKPPQDYKSPLQVFEKTLAHEQTVTASINALMKLAISEDDYATKNRLEWFIEEQVEEEANPTEIINKLKIVGDRGDGILLLDQQLGTRVFTPPPPLAMQ
ncbi:MAG: ferritin [Planctomycetes bacterium]|nr:ferritin [Planctomycetota bacterium]